MSAVLMDRMAVVRARLWAATAADKRATTQNGGREGREGAGLCVCSFRGQQSLVGRQSRVDGWGRV